MDKSYQNALNSYGDHSISNYLGEKTFQEENDILDGQKVVQ